jgi:hypothetical protein
MNRNLFFSCLLACCALLPNKASGQYLPSDYTISRGWTDIENGVVFTKEGVVRIPIYSNKRQNYQYHFGFAYLEANYQRTYINNVTFKLHLNPEYLNLDGETKKIEMTYVTNNVVADEDYPYANTLSDGDEITLDAVNQYLHIYVVYSERASIYDKWFDYEGILDLVVSNWSNITKSTSENYTNYLSNTGTGTPDSYGDYTSYLSNTWQSCEKINIKDNWTGKSGDIYKIGHFASQTVQSLPAGTYTVQGIVRGTKPVILVLNGIQTDTVETYGIDSTATFSTVNTCGRVDYNYDMHNNGWTKVEGTATLSTEGSLSITFSSDAEFQLSDVVLLKDANTKGHYYTSASKVGLSDTYCYLSANEKETLPYSYIDYQGSHSGTVDLYYPQYNAFSFFDRGTNRNFVVYAHPRTVIGCDGIYVDSIDHRHPVNTAVETINTNSNATKDTTGVYECQLLSLYDNVENMKENGNPFGINKDFNAANVVYDRNVKAGQFTTGYFPFALSSEDLNKLYGTSTAYTFKQIGNEDSIAVFTEVSSVDANTPFYIKPLTGTGEDSLITNGKIIGKAIEAVEESTSNSTGSSFEGTYTDQTLTTGEYYYYIFNAQDAEGTFRPTNPNGAYVKPFRAYLQVPAENAASSYTFTVDDSSTSGIENVDTNLNVTNGNSNVYTLDGRQVGTLANWQSLPKGIYIVNGKKIIK